MYPAGLRLRVLLAGDFLTMAGFAKLWGTILDSSVWEEDLATRVVWITLLAMCDQDGMVAAVETALTRRARVSKKECRRALHVLESPDPNSRTPDNEGRRIERVPGGWLILNYRAHRDKKDAATERARTRERVRRHRERKRRYALAAVQDVQNGNGRKRRTVVEVSPPSALIDGGDVTRVTVRNGRLPQAEAEAEAEADTTKPVPTVRASAHWVRALGGIWREHYKGDPPFAKIGKLLLPVKDAPDLAYRFTAYLKATEPQYVNLAKFVETFGSWGNAKAAPQTYAYEPGLKGPAL